MVCAPDVSENSVIGESAAPLRHRRLAVREARNHATFDGIVVLQPLDRTNEIFFLSPSRLLRATGHLGHQVPRVVDVRQGERHVGVISTRRSAIRGE